MLKTLILIFLYKKTLQDNEEGAIRWGKQVLSEREQFNDNQLIKQKVFHTQKKINFKTENKMPNNFYEFEIVVPISYYEHYSYQDFLEIYEKTSKDGKQIKNYFRQNSLCIFPNFFDLENSDFRFKFQIIGSKGQVKDFQTKEFNYSENPELNSDFFFRDIGVNKKNWLCNVVMDYNKFDPNQNIIDIFFMIYNFKQNSQIYMDFFFLNPIFKNDKLTICLQKQNEDFNLSYLEDLSNIDCISDLPLNPKYRPFLDLLVLGEQNRLNSRFRGYLDVEKDLKKLQNFLGYSNKKNESPNFVLKINEFNFINGYFSPNFEKKRNFEEDKNLFHFNIVKNNDNFNITFNEQKKSINIDCKFLNEFLIEKLNASENTDFYFQFKASRNDAEVNFLLGEKYYSGIDTKNTPNFSFDEFFNEKLLSDDQIFCDINFNADEIQKNTNENLKVKINIHLNPKEEITNIKLLFKEEGLEANIVNSTFQTIEKNLLNCKIINPENYPKIGNKRVKIVFKGKIVNEKRDFLTLDEIESEMIMELYLSKRESEEISECYIDIDITKSLTYVNFKIFLVKFSDKINKTQIIYNEIDKSLKILSRKDENIDSAIECYNSNILQNLNLDDFSLKQLEIYAFVQHEKNNFYYKDIFFKLTENVYYINIFTENIHDYMTTKNLTEGKLKCHINSANSKEIEISFFYEENYIHFSENGNDKNYFNKIEFLHKDKVFLSNNTLIEKKQIKIFNPFDEEKIYKKNSGEFLNIFFFHLYDNNIRKKIPFKIIKCGEKLCFHIINLKQYSFNHSNYQEIFEKEIYNSEENLYLSIINDNSNNFLKITIWKNKSQIFKKKIMYSLEKIILGNKQGYYTTQIGPDNYQSVRILSEFKENNKIPIKNILFNKENEIRLRKNLFMKDDSFFDLIENLEYPKLELKNEKIDSRDQNNLYFYNSKEKNRLMYFCLFIEKNLLKFKIYDFNKKGGLFKELEFKNYDSIIPIYKSKKDMTREASDYTYINLSFKFADKKEKVFKQQFFFDLINDKITCDYIYLPYVLKASAFDTKKDDLKVEKMKGNGKRDHLVVSVDFEEKIQSLLI